MFTTDETNLTVVLPGPCNAKCNFCLSKNEPKVDKDYLVNLRAAINLVPKEIDQVSISGGEPTLSPMMAATLRMLKRRFKKVVLTTNGAKLIARLDTIKAYVTHVNLSRHSADLSRNQDIFNTKSLITDGEIEYVADELGKKGIDLTFNCVYDEDEFSMTRPNALALIDNARSLGAVRVNFRYNQNLNTLDPSTLEKSFDDYNQIGSSGCPVCFTRTKRIKGLPVSFKYTLAEPGHRVSDIYELIIQPNGELTTDWEGKVNYANVIKTMELLENRPKIQPAQYQPSQGCGSGGCGSPVVYSGYSGSCGGGRSSGC